MAIACVFQWCDTAQFLFGMSSKKAGNYSSSIVKRKHKSLSIEQKVYLLRKLDNGASVKKLCEENSVDSSAVYDLKQKSELLKFYADSDTPRL
jgi:hypothetical protein